VIVLVSGAQPIAIPYTTNLTALRVYMAARPNDYTDFGKKKVFLIRAGQATSLVIEGPDQETKLNPWDIFVIETPRTI
jgi:hypothetical protein